MPERENPRQALSHSQGSQENIQSHDSNSQQLLNEPISFKHMHIIDQATYVINTIDSLSTDIHTKLT